MFKSLAGKVPSDGSGNPAASNNAVSLKLHRQLTAIEKNGDPKARTKKTFALQPNIYVQQRRGKILNSSMILKSSLFAKEQGHLDTHISGAPNYRHAARFPVIGCAQPTVYGIRTILNMLNTGRPDDSHVNMGMRHNNVVWINLREEPVIYINNRPFVLREFEHPFKNMTDFDGMTVRRIEGMEKLHDEVVEREVRPLWESVSPSTVQSPAEIFDLFKQEYRVSYMRLPVTATSMFSPTELDRLLGLFVQSLTQHSLSETGETHFVFNCQMGKGRSSVGMVVMCLLHSHVRGEEHTDGSLNVQPVVVARTPGNRHGVRSPRNSRPASPMPDLTPSLAMASSSSSPFISPSTPKKLSLGPPRTSSAVEQAPDNDNANEIEVINSLVRLIGNGKDAKLDVDRAINMCDRVHDLREVILQSYYNFVRARDEAHADRFAIQTFEALLRYFVLICFQSYLRDLPRDLCSATTEDGTDGKKLPSFAAWVMSRTDIKSLQDRFNVFSKDALRDLIGTGEEHDETKDVSTAFGGVTFQYDDAMRRALKYRIDSFSVLTKRLVLKTEVNLFSASNAVRHLQKLGSPGFRLLPDMPLGAVGQPTVQGVEHVFRAVVQHVNNLRLVRRARGVDTPDPSLHRGAAHRYGSSMIDSQEVDEADLSHPVHVLWINLREEPVIYINKRSVLLRQAKSPFRIMSDFSSGITPDIADDVEERLRAEVVQEWENSDGCVLLHEEDSQRVLVPAMAGVPDSSHIKTSRTMLTSHAMLKAGERELNVTLSYHRLPLLVDRTPAPTSFDALFDLLTAEEAIGEDTVTILNSMRGGRRSTLALVLATLIRMHQGLLDVSRIDTAGNKEAQAAGHVFADFDESTRHGPSASVSERLSLASPVSVSSPAPAAAKNGEEDDGAVSPEQISLRVSPPSDRTRALSAGNTTSSSSVSKPLLTRSMSGRDLTVLTMEEDEEDPEEQQNSSGNFKGIMALIRILKRGRLVKEEADYAIDLCGDVVHLRNDIYAELGDAETDRGQSDFSQAQKYLETYAFVIIFNAYLHSAFSTKYLLGQPRGSKEKFPRSVLKKDMPFSQWLSARPELELLLQQFRDKPVAYLKLDIVASASQHYKIFENRNGHVLSKGSILKFDYFKGCQNQGLPQLVEGTVNFRMVPKFNVAGTGIPTAEGIFNILGYVVSGKHKVLNVDSCRGVVWLNLREEPLLYVNGQPFCLRDHDTPYSNLEHTGISERRVQAMEKQLKKDVLQEAERYGHRIILHDENEFGNLMGYWESIPDGECLQTPRECFNQVFRAFSEEYSRGPGKGGSAFEAIYCRAVITDEQAPSPHNFDAMVQALESYEERSESPDLPFAIILNCQMGRGRTTTGLILSTLWCIHRGKTNVELSSLSRSREGSKALTSGHKSLLEVEEAKMAETEDEEEGNEALIKLRARKDQLLRGEFKATMALVRVLHGGSRIKEQVDTVIDHVSAMQNLRTVIYDMYEMSLTGLSSRKAKFKTRGTTFLKRYLFLICFNAYFTAEARSGFQKSFVMWYGERPEIDHIINNLDF